MLDNWAFVVISSIVADTPNPAHTSVEIFATRHGSVRLLTPLDSLATYLDAHQTWMHRTMQPLKVQYLSDTDYRLEFFRMSGLGFTLEPCFGIRVWSEGQTIHKIRSIRLPSDEGLPYHVDCEASFTLEPCDPPDSPDPEHTFVHWALNLHITLELPPFLQVFPYSLVKQVGVNVVNQVTKTLTDRLTRNVCLDYYSTVGLDERDYEVVKASSIRNEPFSLDGFEEN